MFVYVHMLWRKVKWSHPMADYHFFKGEKRERGREKVKEGCLRGSPLFRFVYSSTCLNKKGLDRTLVPWSSFSHRQQLCDTSHAVYVSKGVGGGSIFKACFTAEELSLWGNQDLGAGIRKHWGLSKGG